MSSKLDYLKKYQTSKKSDKKKREKKLLQKLEQGASNLAAKSESMPEKKQFVEMADDESQSQGSSSKQKRELSCSSSEHSQQDSGSRRKRRRLDANQSDDSSSEQSADEQPNEQKEDQLNHNKQVHAGLQTSSMLKEEATLQSQAAMESKSKGPSEAQQQTVHRDKAGRIVALEEKLVSDKDRLQKTNKEALATWAAGAKQKQDKRDLREAIEEAKSGKFGKSSLDPLVERELKDRERFGDPMRLMQSQTVRYGSSNMLYRILTTQSSQKFILQRSKFPGTQNRFGIDPGSKWDGVDRGNQYERKWMSREADLEANKSAFHKWATEEM